MRNLRIVSSLLVVLILGSSAQAQTGDWQTVENLAPGTIISVTVQRHVRCVFERANEDELECAPIRRGLFPSGPSVMRFSRRSVLEVRLEYSDTANAAVGAAIGGGVGAAFGASNSNGTLTRGGGALLFGSIGAVIGGFVGRDVPIVHGKIIYQR